MSILSLELRQNVCSTVYPGRASSRELDAQRNSISSGSSAVERSCGAIKQYLIPGIALESACDFLFLHILFSYCIVLAQLSTK